MVCRSCLSSLFSDAIRVGLGSFVRFEQFDTQSAVPSGFTENPATDRQVITLGLAFYPHPDVALKVDREMWEDEADGDGNRTNAALAFIF